MKGSQWQQQLFTVKVCLHYLHIQKDADVLIAEQQKLSTKK